MTETSDIVLQFLDGEIDNLPKGISQNKFMMLALRIERADRKQDMQVLQGVVNNNAESIKKFINGNGFEKRLKSLEDKEDEREETKKDRKETYFKPFVGGLAGGVSTLLLALVVYLIQLALGV